jgi:hypothetical protein
VRSSATRDSLNGVIRTQLSVAVYSDQEEYHCARVITTVPRTRIPKCQEESVLIVICSQACIRPQAKGGDAGGKAVWFTDMKPAPLARLLPEIEAGAIRQQ